tara:strand:+ start:3232 stop:3618 length:387 start_codon:yes stop_codon:yes gene_type:complete
LIKQILKFLIAGGAAALANIGTRVIFSNFFSYEVSILLSFCVGLTSGFILMKEYVFDLSSNSLTTQVLKYVLVNLAALLQTFLISIYLNNFLLLYFYNTNFTETTAHSIGVIFPVFTSYFAHRIFTFK